MHRTRAKINFTKRSIGSLATPADGKRQNFFDVHTPGLGLLLHSSGARSFFHLKFVNGSPKRTTIGKFPEFTVEQARGKASALNAALAKWKLNDFVGPDPSKRPGHLTLDKLVTAYIERHVPSLAHPDRAEKAVNWQFNKYLASWRNRRIDFIRRAEVSALKERLGRESGHTTANRTVQLLRRLFNWAQSEEMWDGENPAVSIKMFHEDKRTRFLQPDELPRFFTALKKEKNIDLRDFVNLALWTGARRGDIFSMRWENVALDDHRWQVPHPKGGDPYFIALTPEAVEILKARRKRAKNENPWVFPSRGKTGHLVDLKTAWKELLKRAGVTGLCQHDLRRTLGSFQAAGGSSLLIIGESLGHRSLAATKVYSKLNLGPVRASVMLATRAMIAASKVKPKRSRVPKPKLLEAGRP